MNSLTRVDRKIWINESHCVSIPDFSDLPDEFASLGTTAQVGTETAALLWNANASNFYVTVHKWSRNIKEFRLFGLDCRVSDYKCIT